MTNGINRLTKQGGRGMVCCPKIGFKQKNIHVWLKHFDALVKPIILYACESWGNDNSGSLNSIDPIFKDSFEKFHIKICKQILGTHCKSTQTVALS